MSNAYDKAKWHYGGKWPEGLPESQAYVHTGLYLGWLVDRGLVSEVFEREFRKPLMAFSARQLTGPKLYEECDGVLSDDLLSTEGNEFTAAYFETDDGGYIDDYVGLFPDAPSAYHVSDTWDNYERVRVQLDRRFDAWCAAVAAGAETWGEGLKTRGTPLALHRGPDDAALRLSERLLPLLAPHGFRYVKGRRSFERRDRSVGRTASIKLRCFPSAGTTRAAVDASVFFEAVDRVALRAEGWDAKEARERLRVNPTIYRSLGNWETSLRDFGDVSSAIAATIERTALPLFESARTVADAADLLERVLRGEEGKPDDHGAWKHLSALFVLRDRVRFDSARARWLSVVRGHEQTERQVERRGQFLAEHWDDDLSGAGDDAR